MADQSVTGSCQQCGRTYALLVPEPGSDDLAFDRVTGLFGWCAECGRLVGRACCWGSDGRCTGCAAARAPGEAGGFAALGAARAAVRQLDGTAAHFSAVEDAIAATVAAGPRPSEAWGRSWLAAGTLRARIDGTREAAESLLQGIPAHDAARATELRDELLDVEAFLGARWRGIAEAMADAGRRLSGRSAMRRRRAGPAVDRRPRPREAVAAVRGPARSSGTAIAVAVAVPIPIRAPDRAVIAVPAAVPVAAAMPARTSTGTEHSVIPPRVAPASLPPRAHWVGQPPAPAQSRVDALPAPAGRSVRQRRPGRAGSLLVAVIALALAAAIAVVARQPDAAADVRSDVEGFGDPGATTPAIARAPTPSASPSQSSGDPQDLPSIVLTVDEHPVGPLDPDVIRVTRVVGAPEVAAFPSAFDRSLRLNAPSAGLCIAQAAVHSALILDLHLGELGTGTGRLVASFGAGAPGLALDLASLATLDRSAWYRLTLTADGAAGGATVTAIADEGPVLDVDLEAGTSDLTATPGEICLHAELQETGTSVVVDNLRVGG